MDGVLFVLLITSVCFNYVLWKLLNSEYQYVEKLSKSYQELIVKHTKKITGEKDNIK